MKKRRGLFMVMFAIAAGCWTTHAAIVDVTEGVHWAQAFDNPVTLRWHQNWLPADAVEAHLSITGMSVQLSETLAPDAESYVWNVQLADVIEDLCDIRLVFVNAQGESLYALEAKLAVSQNAFKRVNVMTGDDKDWAKVKSDVLIPWNARWLDATDLCKQVDLEWTNIQSGSVVSFSSFGFYLFTVRGRPKGEYDFTLSFLDENATLIGEPLSATVFVLAQGSVIMLK